MSATLEPTAPDILGEPWVARRIPVTESPTKAPGADHAVLVFQREAAGRASRPRHSRAVLYLHGRSDYFFQTHLAQAYLDAGFEFYALDLRACGRAGVGHPSPHDVRDLRVHDEEIAEGYVFAAASADGANSLVITYAAMDAAMTAEEAQPGLAEVYPTATVQDLNGTSVVAFHDAEEDVLGIVVMDTVDAGYYIFMFTPASDEAFLPVADAIAASFTAAQ